MSEFFAMGGYALYVWTSYGLALVLLLANVLIAHSRHARLRERADGLLRRGGAR